MKVLLGLALAAGAVAVVAAVTHKPSAPPLPPGVVRSTPKPPQREDEELQQSIDETIDIGEYTHTGGHYLRGRR